MSAGARHCADINGTFAGPDYAPKAPDPTKAPLRDFAWRSILNRGVVAFSAWRDGLPEKRIEC